MSPFPSILRAVGGAVFLFSSQTIATADWQYTRWGDTPEQVQRASAGMVAPYNDRKRDTPLLSAKLAGMYKAGSTIFTAYFSFDKDDHLAAVDLQAERGVNCDLVVFELTKSYGPPQDRSPHGLMKWWDKNNGNVVIYTNYGSCAIRYLPFVAAGRAGGL